MNLVQIPIPISPFLNPLSNNFNLDIKLLLNILF